MRDSTPTSERRLFVHEHDFSVVADDLDSPAGGFVATRLAAKLTQGERIVLAIYTNGETLLEVPVIVAGRRFTPHQGRAPIGVYLRLAPAAVDVEHQPHAA